MMLKEFIEVLQEFPPESEVVFCDDEGGYNGDVLFGIHHSEDSNYEYPEDNHNATLICLMNEFHHYNDLVHNEREISTWYSDEKVWYNTIDPIETWDCEDKRVRLYYNPETKKFQKETLK